MKMTAVLHLPSVPTECRALEARAQELGLTHRLRPATDGIAEG
jgi:hypothetical protein